MPSTPFRVDAQECNNSSRLSGCCFDNATRRQLDARGTTLLVDALTISRRRATAIASTPRSAVQRPHRLPPAEHIPIGGARRVRRAGSSPCATAPRSRCPRPCRCAIPEPRAASRNGGRRGAITPSPCGDERNHHRRIGHVSSQHESLRLRPPARGKAGIVWGAVSRYLRRGHGCVCQRAGTGLPRAPPAQEHGGGRSGREHPDRPLGILITRRPCRGGFVALQGRNPALRRRARPRRARRGLHPPLR